MNADHHQEKLEDLEHLKWMYERLSDVHLEPLNVDYMLRFKKILNKMDVELNGDGNMNRDEAINWVKLVYNNTWPRTTNGKAPLGWKWVVRHKPYQLPEYILQSINHDPEITNEDIL